VGSRGREPRPASGHSRAGATHRWGSLTAFRRQSAPHLARLSPRPRDPLIGARGEEGCPSSGAPGDTDETGIPGARSRRLGCGSHLTAAATAAVGTPGGRIAPPGLSRVSRMHARPAGGAPVTVCVDSGRPAFATRPAAPGGDVYQCAGVFNSCCSGR